MEWIRKNGAALAAFATLAGAGVTDRILLENRLTTFEASVDRIDKEQTRRTLLFQDPHARIDGIRSVGHRGLLDEAMYLGVERQIENHNAKMLKAMDERVELYRKEDAAFRRRFRQLNPQLVWPEE